MSESDYPQRSCPEDCIPDLAEEDSTTMLELYMGNRWELLVDMEYLGTFSCQEGLDRIAEAPPNMQFIVRTLPGGE